MSSAAQQRTYPRQVEIARAVRAARASGIDVGSFEVCTDGTIRIIRARSMAVNSDDEFDRLQAEGKL